MLRRALARVSAGARSAALGAVARRQLVARAVTAVRPAGAASAAARAALHTSAMVRGTPSDVHKETEAGASSASTSNSRATRGSLFFTPATMPYVRRASERGSSDIGWLRAKYSFSFAPMWKDNAHRGFRQLRVINDDTVMPLGGFDTHGHQNMEIVTYVLSGAIEHEDSLRNKAVIQAGEVQRMSAGKGVQHSEYNRSNTTPVQLLQIWLHPRATGLPPSYQQSCFTDDDKRTSLKLIASETGADGSIVVHTDAKLYAALVGPHGQTQVTHRVPVGRHVYLHVARGDVTVTWSSTDAGASADTQVSGQFGSGDGLGLSWAPDAAGRTVTIAHRPSAANPNGEAEFVLFDLP